MWTVSVALETHSRVLFSLKDMQCIRAGMLPRRNWYSFCAEGMAKTLMMVPFSEAVANKVPSLFMAIHERGA